jgi:pimeloyl-ACP methyl ester carboxylesterase
MTPSPSPAQPAGHTGGSAPAVYRPRRARTERFVPVRGLQVHVHVWGDPSRVTPDRPLLVAVHGWMDIGASFQFMVDALADDRCVVAPDWRGFGRTAAPPGTDAYWFADYLGDLDGLLDRLSPDAPVDLLGHSMGGNVAMSYAGARPKRLRRLINLEGFGLPATRPSMAPGRLAQWLDELREPQGLKPYPSLAAVADRLQQNNPLLPRDKALWLAGEWAEPRAAADGTERWHLRADAAHKRTNPVLYQVEEVLETWRRIEAPLLWAEGDRTDVAKWWGQRYPREEFDRRLAQVPQVERVLLSPCGHMLHHDQPEALAGHVERFLA